MKKTKHLQKLTIAVVMILSSVATPALANDTLIEYVSKYSSSAPVLTLTRSVPAEWTNKNITFNVVTTSPVGVPISHVVQPNGNVVSTTNFQYTITSNGIYTFKVFDRDGKIGFNTVQIKGIDRRTPTIKYEPDGQWKNTNQLVDVQIIND